MESDDRFNKAAQPIGAQKPQEPALNTGAKVAQKAGKPTKIATKLKPGSKAGPKAGLESRPKFGAKARSKSRSKVAAPQPDWLAIKDRYCAGQHSVDQICRDFGVTKSQLYRRRRKETWPTRKGCGDEAPSRPDALVPNRRKGDRPNRRKGDKVNADANPKSHTSALLDRLYSAFNQQIGELESRFSDPGRLEGEEEKTARTLGTLARTLGKLVELQRDADEQSQHRGDDAADVERLHRELAQRIDRLRRQREAEHPARGA